MGEARTSRVPLGGEPTRRNGWGWRLESCSWRAKGETEVTVDVNRESASTTSVEVVAKKSPVDYDKDFAKLVLTRIVQK